MPSQRSQEDETQTFVEREAYTFISTSAASKETRRRQSNAIAGTGTYPPRKNEPAWPRSWIGWFNNLLRTQNSTSFSNQSRLLNGTHYQPVIILTPDDSGYPIYNLDAKLGTQGGNTSIKFQCSASSDGQSRFQLISVEIRLFHLIEGNAIEATEFEPNTSQRSNQTEVQYDRNWAGNVAVSGGGHGANVGAGIAGGEAQQFVRKEGVTFDGKRTPDYGLKWTWRADLKVVKDGLEDRCKFSLTIPSLDKLEGVKVHFKVIATVVHSSSWWRQKRITLPPHKKLPPHELELHFNDTMPSELT